MSSLAENDLKTLEGLNSALRKWLDIQFNDPANIVLGLREQIVTNDLTDLRRVRWWANHDDVHAEQLWSRFIANAELEGELKDTVFDFYVTGASFIWINTPTVNAHYESFIEHLAQNLSWMSRCRLVPEDVRQYAAGHELIVNFLKGNHWVVFMILLSMLDVK